jgi:hypothetical protein
MSARPFVGFGPEDEAYLERSFIAHLQALIE